ncbi:MAG TPA: pitrilysin family protein [Planctomycetota bacterium]|nr:pitrilysin family protein [Planctomycetota bacterium]
MSRTVPSTRTRDRQLREEIRTARLSCGLQAQVVPKRGVSRKIAIFATRYGSIDLVFSPGPGLDPAPTPAGIAHFLEHQLFKKQDMDVLMEFGRFGASSNAFTDYTSTTYYFSGTEQFEESLDLLVRLVFAPHFTDDGVAKEKLIIEQELKMYDDQPDYRIYKNLMAALYREHPVRIDIGGSVETIGKIDTSLLASCYRRFYHPSNMGFMACGDLDPEDVFRRLEEALPAARFAPANGAIARTYPAEPPGPARELVRESAVVSRPRVIVGYKDLELDGPLLDRDLATSVLLDNLFGPTSAFHAKWYRNGLIDDTFSASHTAEPEFGFTLIGGETDEPEKLAAEIRKEIARASRGRLQRRDVDRARRKRLGRYLRSFDSPDGIGFMVLGFALKGLDVFDFPRALSRLNPRALEKRLKEHLREDRAAVSILEPKRN